MRDFSLRRQRDFGHITDVNNSKRSETAGRGPNPPRPRGRPPLPADEARRHPLTIRTTKALKDDLLRAAKAAGRSLAEEIDFRLGAVRTHPVEGGIDQTLAALEEVKDLIADLQTSLQGLEEWVYAAELGLREAGKASPTKRKPKS